MSRHLAAISPAKGSPLEVTYRPTPSPGPTELLIQVKSIALNPIDYYQRDVGFPPIAAYPAILGSDIAGIVVSAGSAVSADAPKPSSRVASFAHAFFKQGAPDYGAFQTHVLVPAVSVTPIPQSLSFNEAAVLPLAVLTVWSGWYSIGLPRDTAHVPADKKGILVWGGSSSVGSAVVQVAKLMGFIVYATASKKHHDYLKNLGASKLFDYKDEGVVENIVKAAREDGVTMDLGYDAVGQLKQCLNILAALKGEERSRLVSATPLPKDFTPIEGIEVKFVEAPAEPKERMEHFHFVFGVWLKEKLEKGEFVPSPKIKVIEGGLEGLNKGLDELRSGVSGTKLVLEV